jgi:hypothetical protein
VTGQQHGLPDLLLDGHARQALVGAPRGGVLGWANIGNGQPHRHHAGGDKCVVRHLLQEAQQPVL